MMHGILRCHGRAASVTTLLAAVLILSAPGSAYAAERMVLGEYFTMIG